MGRPWWIAFAVAVVPAMMLMILANVMGWDYEVIGLPVIGFLLLGSFVLDRLELRERDRLARSPQAPQR